MSWKDENEDIILKLPQQIKGHFTQINLTAHAQDRMVERNITEEDILRVLTNPDGFIECETQGRKREFIIVKREEIHVVWETDPNNQYRIAVITVVRKERPPGIRRKRRT